MNNQQQPLTPSPQSITQTFSSQLHTVIQSPKREKSQNLQQNWITDLPDKIQLLDQQTLNQYLKNFTVIIQFQKIQKGKPLIQLCKQSPGLKIVKSLINKCYKLFKSPIPTAVLCSFQFIRQLIQIGHFIIVNKVQSLFLMSLVQIVEYRSHIKSLSRGNSYFLNQTYRNAKDESNNDLIRLSMTLFRMVHESLYVWGALYFPDTNFRKIFKKLQKQVNFPKFPQQFKFYNQNKVQMFELQFKKNKKSYYESYLKMQNSKILQKQQPKSKAILKEQKEKIQNRQDLNINNSDINLSQSKKDEKLKNNRNLSSSLKTKSSKTKRKIILIQDAQLNNPKNQKHDDNDSFSSHLSSVQQILTRENQQASLSSKDSLIHISQKKSSKGEITLHKHKQENLSQDTAVISFIKKSDQQYQVQKNQNSIIAQNNVKMQSSPLSSSKAMLKKQLKRETSSKIQKISKQKKMNKNLSKDENHQKKQNLQQLQLQLNQIHNETTSKKDQINKFSNNQQNSINLQDAQDLTKNIQQLKQNHQYKQKQSLKQKQKPQSKNKDKKNQSTIKKNKQQLEINQNQTIISNNIKSLQNIQIPEIEQKKLQIKKQLKLKQKNNLPEIPLGIIYQRSIESSSKQTEPQFSRPEERQQNSSIESQSIINKFSNPQNESLKKAYNRQKILQDQDDQEQRFEMKSQQSQSKEVEVEAEIISPLLQKFMNKQQQSNVNINNPSKQVFQKKNINVNVNVNESMNERALNQRKISQMKNQNKQQNQSKQRENKQKQKQKQQNLSLPLPLPLNSNEPFLQKIQKKITQQLSTFKKQIIQEVSLKFQNSIQLKTMETLENIKKLQIANNSQQFMRSRNKETNRSYTKRSKNKRRSSIKFVQNQLQSESNKKQYEKSQKKQFGVNTEELSPLLSYNKKINQQQSTILKQISQKLKIYFPKKKNDENNNFTKTKNLSFATQIKSNFRNKASSRLRQTSQIKLSQRSKSKGRRNSLYQQLQLSQKINQFCPYPENSLLYSLSKRRSIF